jgi:hypothetical protein
MIRHARAWSASSSPILALPVAVIEPSLGAALITLIGPPALLAPRRVAACGAAIPVPAVAVRADEEHHPAIRAQAKPLQQYRLMRRHAYRRRDWTTAPFRVSLDLFAWSHLLDTKGDDTRASTVGAVGALSATAFCPPYSVLMIGRTPRLRR